MNLLFIKVILLSLSCETFQQSSTASVIEASMSYNTWAVNATNETSHEVLMSDTTMLNAVMYTTNHSYTTEHMMSATTSTTEWSASHSTSYSVEVNPSTASMMSAAGSTSVYYNMGEANTISAISPSTPVSYMMGSSTSSVWSGTMHSMNASLYNISMHSVSSNMHVYNMTMQTNSMHMMNVTGMSSSAMMMDYSMMMNHSVPMATPHLSMTPSYEMMHNKTTMGIRPSSSYMPHSSSVAMMMTQKIMVATDCYNDKEINFDNITVDDMKDIYFVNKTSKYKVSCQFKNGSRKLLGDEMMMLDTFCLPCFEFGTMLPKCSIADVLFKFTSISRNAMIYANIILQYQPAPLIEHPPLYTNGSKNVTLNELKDMQHDSCFQNVTFLKKYLITKQMNSSKCDEGCLKCIGTANIFVANEKLPLNGKCKINITTPIYFEKILDNKGAYCAAVINCGKYDASALASLNVTNYRNIVFQPDPVIPKVLKIDPSENGTTAVSLASRYVPFHSLKPSFFNDDWLLNVKICFYDCVGVDISVKNRTNNASVMISSESSGLSDGDRCIYVNEMVMVDIKNDSAKCEDVKFKGYQMINGNQQSVIIGRTKLNFVCASSCGGVCDCRQKEAETFCDSAFPGHRSDCINCKLQNLQFTSCGSCVGMNDDSCINGVDCSNEANACDINCASKFPNTKCCNGNAVTGNSLCVEIEPPSISGSYLRIHEVSGTCASSYMLKNTNSTCYLVKESNEPKCQIVGTGAYYNINNTCADGMYDVYCGDQKITNLNVNKTTAMMFNVVQPTDQVKAKILTSVGVTVQYVSSDRSYEVCDGDLCENIIFDEQNKFYIKVFSPISNTSITRVVRDCENVSKSFTIDVAPCDHISGHHDVISLRNGNVGVSFTQDVVLKNDVDCNNDYKQIGGKTIEAIIKSADTTTLKIPNKCIRPTCRNDFQSAGEITVTGLPHLSCPIYQILGKCGDVCFETNLIGSNNSWTIQQDGTSVNITQNTICQSDFSNISVNTTLAYNLTLSASLVRGTCMKTMFVDKMTSSMSDITSAVITNAQVRQNLFVYQVKCYESTGVEKMQLKVGDFGPISAVQSSKVLNYEYLNDTAQDVVATYANGDESSQEFKSQVPAIYLCLFNQKSTIYLDVNVKEFQNPTKKCKGNSLGVFSARCNARSCMLQNGEQISINNPKNNDRFIITSRLEVTNKRGRFYKQVENTIIYTSNPPPKVTVQDIVISRTDGKLCKKVLLEHFDTVNAVFRYQAGAVQNLDEEDITMTNDNSSTTICLMKSKMKPDNMYRIMVTARKGNQVGSANVDLIREIELNCVLNIPTNIATNKEFTSSIQVSCDCRVQDDVSSDVVINTYAEVTYQGKRLLQKPPAMNSFKGFCAMPNAVVLQCFGSVEGSTRFFSSTEQSVNIQREVTTPNGLVTVLRDSDSSCQDLPIVLNAVYTKEFESSSSSAQRKRRSVIITTDTCTLEPTTTKCVLLDAAVTAEASNPDPAVPYTTASEKPCEQQKSCTAVKTMFTTYFGADVASFKEPTTVNGIIYYYTALSSLLFPIDTSTTSDVMNMFKGTYYTVQQTLCEKALGETNGANTLATSSSPMNTDCTLFDVDSGNGWRNLHNVAQFQLDQSLFSAIKQGWACTNFLSCSDVMMASIKIKAFENFGAARKLEIFAGENLSSDVDLVTDVFIVSLFGTVQGSSTFNISQSEKPFFLLLPIIGSPTDVVMCHRYDTVMNKWTMDGCQTMSANNKNVTCSCQQYGPMAAFEMPPSFQLSTTTTASTNAQTTMTTASNSSSNATKATTTVDPATISRFESFKIILDENFQEFVAKFANISNATEHLCNQFKNLTGIQFHNCSISDQGNIGLIVFFTGNQSVINQTTTSLLQQANDGIDLKDANGVTLMILSISVGDDSPIVPGNPPPKEDEDNDHITVIVVVVVILTLGLIIIAVIVCFMNQNASSSSKISPSPNGSKVALRETASFQDPIHGNDDVRDENC